MSDSRLFNLPTLKAAAPASPTKKFMTTVTAMFALLCNAQPMPMHAAWNTLDSVSNRGEICTHGMITGKTESLARSSLNSSGASLTSAPTR